MKELEKIGTSILERVEKEADGGYTEPAIGRIDVQENGIDYIFWLVRNIKSTTKISRDILGNVVNLLDGYNTVLNEGGNSNTLSKNSPVGSLFIRIRKGIVNFNNKDYKIISFSEYVPQLAIKDAIDGSVLAEDNLLRFNSLVELLKEYRIKQKEINTITAQKAEATEEKIAESNKRILKLIQEQKQISETVKKYVVDFVSFRDRPILDTEQETLRTQKLLDGVLIINGAPGTGKTVALVQRIKLLTDKEIDKFEGVRLSLADKNLLADKNQNWTFFSPSALLRLYLVDAMEREGLDNPANKAKTWNAYRQTLSLKFKLIGIDNKGAFNRLTSDDNFFNNQIDFKAFVEQFDKYFIDYQIKKIERAITKSHEIKKFIKKWFKIDLTKNIRTDAILHLENLFSFYDSLSSQSFSVKSVNFNFTNIIGKINEQYKEDLQKTSLKIIEEFSPANIEKITDIIKNTKTNEIEIEEDEEVFEEVEDTNVQLNKFDFQFEVNRRIKPIIRKIALDTYNREKFSSTQRSIYDLIKDLVSNDKFADAIQNIGEAALFKKYIEKILRGIEINIFNELPQIYRNFRREVLKNSEFLTENGKNQIKKMIENQRIHTQEEEFLLYTIFRFSKILYNNHHTAFNSSSNHYVRTYRETAIAVIGVDEATDFSLLQLACMTELAHPRFNCITLSGDLMQRMTSNGITNWESYQELYLNTQIGNLNLVYRQTPELLKIATYLYELNYGNPDFQYYIEGENGLKENFKPLLFKHKNQKKQLEWVAKRIKEIYTYYANNLPSIAVIVKDDSQVFDITKRLNYTNLQDFTQAQACLNGQILGDKGNVRVFSIEYVKGMEFQAVFFLNIDDYEKEELLEKYVYVGFTRANLFLAVTAKNGIPEKIKGIKQFFIENGDWKAI